MCRTDLDRPGIELVIDGGGKVQCPECGADLEKYLDFKSHAESYAGLVRDLISRGELAKARQILNAIPRVVGDKEFDLTALQARLAMLEGGFDRARQLCANLPGMERAGLEAEIAEAQERSFRARELYNYALSSARIGELDKAADYLGKAVSLDAGDPAIWRLKLKVDLKSGRLGSCYEDLATLDRLAARPPEFSGLEHKLPPR